MLDMDPAVFSWFPHGRAIKVHDERRFLAEIAPRFFKVSKFRSFTRQLHLWGFRRISSGVDTDGWWNQYFLRGRPDLICRMVRTKVKGNGKGKRDTVRAPDFYAMPLPDGVVERTSAPAPVGAPSLPDAPKVRVSNSGGASKGEKAAVDCASSLLNIMNYVPMTTDKTATDSRREAEIDAEMNHFFRNESWTSYAPRRVSTATTTTADHHLRNISPYPYDPHSGEQFNNTWESDAWQTNPWQTETRERGLLTTHGSTLVAPSIGDPREIRSAWSEPSRPLEPISLSHSASSNTFGYSLQEEDDEFRAFIGRQIKFP